SVFGRLGWRATRTRCQGVSVWKISMRISSARRRSDSIDFCRSGVCGSMLSASISLRSTPTGSSNSKSSGIRVSTQLHAAGAAQLLHFLHEFLRWPDSLRHVGADAQAGAAVLLDVQLQHDTAVAAV